MPSPLPTPELEQLVADAAPTRDAARTADALRQAQDAIVHSCRSAPPPRFVIATTTSLLIAASQLDEDGAHKSLHIAELWLSAYDYELIATRDERIDVVRVARDVLAGQPSLQLTRSTDDDPQHDPAPSDDSAISDLKVWVTEHTFSKTTGDSLTTVQEDSLMGNHPSSYVGCSITAIGFDDVGRNEEMCDVISSTLSEANVVSYLPIRVDSPRKGAQWSDRPDSRLVDEVQVASSSLTVILLSTSAAGLGALAEMSARYHVPMLVVTDHERVSPMITGLFDLVTIVPMSGDLAETIREYTRTEWPSLVAHARTLRGNRSRWRREIADFTERLSRLSDRALHAVADVRISRSRFHSLLANEVLWGGATHDEMSQLRSLLAGEPRRLRREQQRALLLAEIECGWSQAVSQRLERITCAAMAEGVSQRLNPNQPAYWIDLYEREK